jgi:hypothetical protein
MTDLNTARAGPGHLAGREGLLALRIASRHPAWDGFRLGQAFLGEQTEGTALITVHGGGSCVRSVLRFQTHGVSRRQG